MPEIAHLSFILTAKQTALCFVCVISELEYAGQRSVAGTLAPADALCHNGRMLNPAPAHRQRKLPLLLLTACYLALAGVYLYLVPPLDGPDAGGHLRYTAFLQRERRLPRLSSEEAAYSHELVQQPPLYYAAAALLTPHRWLAAALDEVIESPYVAEGSAQRNTVILPSASRRSLATLTGLRLLSLLGGLVAVLGTWLMTRELLPGRPSLAMLAAALLAFNPQFICISTAISNDAWLAGAVALAAWLGARASRRGSATLPWLLAGAGVGLTALCKYSGLAVLAPLALLWLASARRSGWRSWKAWLPSGAALALGFLAIAGWWYARNLALYGELVPLKSALPLLPGLARSTPASAAELWQALRWLPRSYWAVFGYGVLAPPSVYYVVLALLTFGLVGCIRLALRRGAAREGLALLVGAVWLLAALASLLSWIRSMRYADQGRLLYGAAPALALLLSLGLAEVGSRLRLERTPAWASLLLAGLALAPLPTIARAYTPPSALNGAARPQRPMDYAFAGGMRVLGIDLPDGASLTSGTSLRVHVYLTCDQPISAFYTAFLHLTDALGAPVYYIDAPPFDGRHPTRQWLPGEVYVEEFVIPADSISREGTARLTYGYYPAGNAAAGEEMTLAAVRLHPSTPAEAIPEPLAGWENGIRLYLADIERDDAGVPLRLSLAWGTTIALDADYTVSVQWLDDAGRLLAQVDRQPEDGNYPSSTWQPGRLVQDTYLRSAGADDWRKVIVLLYDRAGARLRTADGAEYWVLAER